ncbi:MAG TPA: hypothetical protein VGE90_07655 [Chitinophaga sp.]
MTRLSFMRNPSTASLRLLIPAFAVMQLFSSCDRKKICPAFSYGNYDAWFPYTEGQQLLFMNARQEKDSIIIFQNSRSTATEKEWGWWGSEPRCSMESEIKGGEGYGYLNIACDIREDYKDIRAGVGGFTVSGGSIGDTGLVRDTFAMRNSGYKSTYHSSLILNGKTFPSVQLFERDTVNIQTEGVWRMYLCKGNGIIAYETYPAHELWVKQ